MSTPYMCGDDKSPYVPSGGCDCNYNLLEVATTEYAHLYQMTLNGDPRGDQIIVPLDIRVSDAQIRQVTTANVPYGGAVVGDWYLHLTVTNGEDLYTPLPTATASQLGLVQPDGTTIQVSGGAISVPIATTSRVGLVMPDNDSISIDANGVLSVNFPTITGVNMTALTVSLTVANWSSNTQTVTATGVTASNNVIVSPAPSYVSAYTEAGIICTAQASNSLTFTCETVPTSAITVNVLILSST